MGRPVRSGLFSLAGKCACASLQHLYEQGVQA
jgi:hypothetical protein